VWKKRGAGLRRCCEMASIIEIRSVLIQVDTSWIPAFAGMTEKHLKCVIPAKAGIQKNPGKSIHTVSDKTKTALI
jgi:hypothetical protein